MDRDSFIIAVFLTACEQYNFIKQSCKIRRGGFAPALSDEEVITIEICGEYFKLECDKDIGSGLNPLIYNFSFDILFSHYETIYRDKVSVLWR
ncbi:MAG: hypothetical protein ACTFAK_12825 [Candidatus Electronema sp. VV]